MGIHFVECFPRHFPIDAADDVLRDNQAILKKAQIQLAGYGVVEFTRDHEANRRMFEQARRAGVRNITANPQPDSFESLERLVAEFDIRIAIHNHGPGALYDSIESVTRAVEKRHKWIGACIDTGHFLRSKEDPVRAVRELGKRVFALHIKDEARQEKDSHNVVIGRGHLDVVGLFQALKEVGFPADGDLALEYEANPANPIDDMKACLDVAREAIQKVAKA
ncbi:MAG: sugar phosphate isomerase/epimerase [Planctomycetes bacterium]|nr:sugar phosphate isomerase/epimerase [Planctomycetota bacterium]